MSDVVTNNAPIFNLIYEAMRDFVVCDLPCTGDLFEAGKIASGQNFDPYHSQASKNSTLYINFIGIACLTYTIDDKMLLRNFDNSSVNTLCLYSSFSPNMHWSCSKLLLWYLWKYGICKHSYCGKKKTMSEPCPWRLMEFCHLRFCLRMMKMKLVWKQFFGIRLYCMNDEVLLWIWSTAQEWVLMIYHFYAQSRFNGERERYLFLIQ